MRKVKKLGLKPWVTKGIKTFMKQREELYKEATKEKDNQRKMKKYKTYKRYWNKIKDLSKVIKQTQKYFEENKKL